MRTPVPVLLILVFLLFTASGWSHTQVVLSKNWYGNCSLGIGAGPVIFFGDLKVHDFFPATTNENEIRYAGNVYIIRQLSHVFALRAQALYGEIAGTKREYKSGAPCNLYFEGNFLEYNLNATINFSNLLFRYKPKRIFFIYGTLGAGMSNWITKKKQLYTHDLVARSGSESNWTTEWVIPAGLGAYFNIADKVNLGLEYTLHAVNSDKLDVTVGGYPYDMYSYLSLNLVYNFNRRNPVDLKAVEASMPPVMLPKPSYPKPEPATKDTLPSDSLHAVAQKPSGLALLPIAPADSAGTMVTDSLATEETDPAKRTIVPYVHPGVEADIFYRIQIFSSKTGQHTPASLKAHFKLSQPVTEEYSEGYHRYYVGEFESEEEAKQFVKSLRMKPGLSGAFVVKYINGQRELTHPK